LIKRILVLAVAGFLAFHAFRTALVSLPADARPVSLEKLWP